VAIVGSGPSGLYAAEALSKTERVDVDVYDRLPFPFGLVRYGVAPDHESIRSVRNTLASILDLPTVRFFGNVDVGSDVTVENLGRAYHAVIWAYGASGDRALGIPGEGMAGSVAATAFVAWYTGHPDADPNIGRLITSASEVAVIGVGNVALDVARILVKSPDALSATDMPAEVLDVLRASSVRDVHVLGRRSAAFAAFTTKELREFGELDGVDVAVSAEDLSLGPNSTAQLAESKVAARNVEALREWVGRQRSAPKCVHFHFCVRPESINGGSEIESLTISRMRETDSGDYVETGEVIDLPVQAVVRSVGYRGHRVGDLPFDNGRGVLNQEAGRLVQDGAPLTGHYTVGWIKRGPTGIIGTNKKDAVATVASLIEDLDSLPDPELSVAELHGQLVGPIVTDAGWRAIDAAEVALGQQQGRDRCTLTDREELLALAISSTT
jgi:ferredoxin--NADP+ reductase